MAKTTSERMRAYYLRKKVKNGKATDAERAELAEYESGRKRGNRANLSAPKVGASPTNTNQGWSPPSGFVGREPPSGARTTPEHSNPPNPTNTPSGETAAAAARSRVQVGWGAIKRLDAPTSEEPSKPGEDGTSGVCTIPDCPKCKQVAGALTCGTTGEKVWPPMSIEAAQSMAAGILYVIAIAVRIFRKDKVFISPTDDEKMRLALGIREMQIRRVSWFGAVSDLTLVGGALAGYTMRAVMTPERKQLPPNLSQAAAPSPERVGNPTEDTPPPTPTVDIPDAAE